MFSLWNPTDQPEDILATFYYADGSGKYVLPVHLEPQASTMIDMAMLIMEHKSDASGNVIPPNIQEGSAQFESAKGHREKMTLVVAGGIYNVVDATCGSSCVTCCGDSNWGITPNPIICLVGESMTCGVTTVDCNGYSVFPSSWSSSNTAVMTVNSSGVVTGHGVGTANITAIYSFAPVYTGTVCGGQNCPTGSPQPSAPADVNSITVHWGPPGASLTSGDNLSFSQVAQTCSLTLGLKDCHAAYPSTWVWNVEIEADVFDDAGNYTVGQGLTGQTTGLYKASDGSLKSFSTSTNKPVPQDVIPSAVLQQVAGQKVIFWLDAPGRGTIYTDPKNSANTGPIDSMTDVKNFTSQICSKNNPANCWPVNWYIKIVVRQGAILDFANSSAGFGTAP